MSNSKFQGRTYITPIEVLETVRPRILAALIIFSFVSGYLLCIAIEDKARNPHPWYEEDTEAQISVKSPKLAKDLVSVKKVEKHKVVIITKI